MGTQALGSKYVSRPPLSLREKLDLPLRIFIWAPIQLTINVLRVLLAACLLRALPLRPFLTCAAIRMFLYTFTPRQMQLFLPPTVDTYRGFIRGTRARARRRGDADLLEQLREDVEVLPDGASHLLWVGDRSRATRFVYFFHGGGYMVPALRGHLEWCLQAYVLAPRHRHRRSSSGGGQQRQAGEDEKGAEEKRGGRRRREEEKEEEMVAVAVLQYTLAPTARFPTQMTQAAAGLRHLLATNPRIRPGSLVVGGDSAGGNLTMQLLGHLMHPYPGITNNADTTTIPPANPAAAAAAAEKEEEKGRKKDKKKEETKIKTKPKNTTKTTAAAAEKNALLELELEEPLAGVFLVSPLVSGATDTRSFRDGRACDMLSAGIFDDPRREMFHQPSSSSQNPNHHHYWGRRAVVEETKEFREGRGWALAGDVGEDWLEGMGRVVRRVYVTCGRHEILRDQGIEIAERIRRRNLCRGGGGGGGGGGVDVRLEVAEKEAHDFILLEGERREVGDATLRMRGWFSSVWGW